MHKEASAIIEVIETLLDRGYTASLTLRGSEVELTYVTSAGQRVVHNDDIPDDVLEGLHDDTFDVDCARWMVAEVLRKEGLSNGQS